MSDLSAEEREQLTAWCSSHFPWAITRNNEEEEYNAVCKVVRRLLASRPAPDYRAAITALLDSDMPAGELRKALAEIVGLR